MTALQDMLTEFQKLKSSVNNENFNSKEREKQLEVLQSEIKMSRSYLDTLLL